jgi:hypothetical protein
MQLEAHDFRKSLALSHEYADAPWWFEVYRAAFPGLQSAVSVRADGWAQRGGIDRVLTLSSGKTQTVDEKVRAQDWPDILLERWSDKAQKKPGWIQKDLACDFLAYAFIPSRTCYLYPFPSLRAAWLKYGREWCERYPAVLAQNKGYVTESVPVPIDVLNAALLDAMRVTWSE